MKSKQTVASFFDRQTPMSFPLPKYRKPYVRVVTFSTGQYEIKASYKASGSAKIELLKEGEIEEKLFIQGTDYPELVREAQILRELVRQGKL